MNAKELKLLENLVEQFNAQIEDVKYWAGMDNSVEGARGFARGLRSAKIDLIEVIREIKNGVE